jgi:hypothetical protein
MTLGTYGHLFPTLDDALTERLNEALASRSGTRLAHQRDSE